MINKNNNKKSNFHSNLFLLVLLSILTGSAFIPFWFLMKKEVFKLSKALKAVLIFIIFSIVISQIYTGYLSANKKLLDDKYLYDTVLKDVSDWDDNNFLYMKQRNIIEMQKSYVSLFLSFVGLFLLSLSFSYRKILNDRLKNIAIKTIPMWQYIFFILLFYIIYKIGLEAPSGMSLIWTNLPLIFLIQKKINDISNEEDETVEKSSQIKASNKNLERNIKYKQPQKLYVKLGISLLLIGSFVLLAKFPPKIDFLKSGDSTNNKCVYEISEVKEYKEGGDSKKRIEMEESYNTVENSDSAFRDRTLATFDREIWEYENYRWYSYEGLIRNNSDLEQHLININAKLRTDNNIFITEGWTKTYKQWLAPGEAIPFKVIIKVESKDLIDKYLENDDYKINVSFYPWFETCNY